MYRKLKGSINRKSDSCSQLGDGGTGDFYDKFVFDNVGQVSCPYVPHEESDSNFLCREENIYGPVEYQANQFAACLLMPKPLIENVVYELVESNSLNRFSLYKLDGKLEVSITALRLRLKKLKLIEVKNNDIIPLVGTNEGIMGFEF